MPDTAQTLFNLVPVLTLLSKFFNLQVGKLGLGRAKHVLNIMRSVSDRTHI